MVLNTPSFCGARLTRPSSSYHSRALRFSERTREALWISSSPSWAQASTLAALKSSLGHRGMVPSGCGRTVGLLPPGECERWQEELANSSISWRLSLYPAWPDFDIFALCGPTEPHFIPHSLAELRAHPMMALEHNLSSLAAQGSLQSQEGPPPSKVFTSQLRAYGPTSLRRMSLALSSLVLTAAPSARRCNGNRLEMTLHLSFWMDCREAWAGGDTLRVLC